MVNLFLGLRVVLIVVGKVSASFEGWWGLWGQVMRCKESSKVCSLAALYREQKELV